MSQIQIPASSQPPPPSVPTDFNTDSGTATPVLNILNIYGIDSTSNIDNGIQTTGSGNTVNIILTNRTTGTVSTTDATLTTIITLPLGAAPGTYYLYGNIQAFDSSIPAGASYSYGAAVRTDGASATLISAAYHDEFEEAALAAADIFMNVSGNNAILQVQGDVGLSMNWNALLEFRKVS